MKFVVRFWSEGYALNEPCNSVGIDDIDAIREELNDSSISIDAIQDEVSCVEDNPCIEISESEARRIGCFADNNVIGVKCSDGLLGAFANKHARVSRSRDGVITSAWLEYVLDEDVVIEIWIDNGCPLVWNEL